MEQEDLTSFDGGVSDRSPVAWAYEIRETAGEDGHEKHGWSQRLQQEEPDPDRWRKTESEYYHFRNITPLRRSRKDRPENAVGYRFKYRNFNGDVKSGLSKDDPRGPETDSLVECHALVPIEE